MTGRQPQSLRIIIRLSPVISSEDDILTDRKWETHSSQSLEEEDETFLDDLLYITEALLLENEEEPGIRFHYLYSLSYSVQILLNFWMIRNVVNGQIKRQIKIPQRKIKINSTTVQTRGLW